MFLDMGPLADAIFRSDTALDVERLSRAFPTETEAWRNHAEGLLWETLQWKMTNVPAFTRRLQHSSGANFNLTATSNYWGTGPDGRGRNMYGRLLSQFRDLQLGIGTLGHLSQQTDSSDSSREYTPPPVRYRRDEGKYSGSQEPSTSSRGETVRPTMITDDEQDGGKTPTEGRNTTGTETTTLTADKVHEEGQVTSPERTVRDRRNQPANITNTTESDAQSETHDTTSDSSHNTDIQRRDKTPDKGNSQSGNRTQGGSHETTPPRAHGTENKESSSEPEQPIRQQRLYSTVLASPPAGRHAIPILRAYSAPPRIRRQPTETRRRGQTYKQYKTREKGLEDSSTGMDSSTEMERIHSTPTGTLATSLIITPGTSMTDWDNSTDTEQQNDDGITEQPVTESLPSIP
ncbi:hypothetical protein LSAT2_029398, partial [Lamellibrachia satsuma]